MNKENILQEFILTLLSKGVDNLDDFMHEQRIFAKSYKGSFLRKDDLLTAYRQLLEEGKIEENNFLLDVLKVKKVRSISGTVSVSVLTKPFECPGKCIYCPNEEGLPKSYLGDEPAVMRAKMNKFDPYMQVHNRIKALEAVGHKTDKISIRIVGGTWSFYDRKYQTWFVKRLFQACNDYPKVLRMSKRNLKTLQIDNYTSSKMIVEMGVETRQNFINKEEIIRLRGLGVTKVELGVQSVYDSVLSANNRGNTAQDTIDATKMLKDAGFKVSYQLMLNLYGSTIEKDLSMFSQIFSADFCPDHIKIYPLAVLKEAPLYKLYKQKKFNIYSDDQLIDLITKIKLKVPYYCRIERVIRDIPAHYIEAGSKKSNLRQIIQWKMKEADKVCKCIRCREVKKFKDEKICLFTQEYDASCGKEVFISFESNDRSNLYGFLRLRIPSFILNNEVPVIKELSGCAIIREITACGQGVPSSKDKNINSNSDKLIDDLIAEATKIAKKYGLNKIAVLLTAKQGFYTDRGFKTSGGYQIKDI